MNTLPGTYGTHTHTNLRLFLTWWTLQVTRVTHWWTLSIQHHLNRRQRKIPCIYFEQFMHISTEYHQFRTENTRIQGQMHDFYPGCFRGDIPDPSPVNDPQRGSPGRKGHQQGC